MIGHQFQEIIQLLVEIGLNLNNIPGDWQEIVIGIGDLLFDFPALAILERIEIALPTAWQSEVRCWLDHFLIE